MDDKEQLLQEIEDEVRIAAIRLQGTMPRTVTRTLTRVVAGVIAERGMLPLLEHPVLYEGRRGRFDVVGLCPSTGCLRAPVEIYIGFKRKSIRRLEEAALPAESVGPRRLHLMMATPSASRPAPGPP